MLLTVPLFETKKKKVDVGEAKSDKRNSNDCLVKGGSSGLVKRNPNDSVKVKTMDGKHKD